MSKSKEMEIRHKADSIESVLMVHGIAHLQNEPGVSFGVVEELNRRYRNSDLKVEHPPRGFGGEYIFRSASHLGRKPEGGDA